MKAVFFIFVYSVLVLSAFYVAGIIVSAAVQMQLSPLSTEIVGMIVSGTFYLSFSFFNQLKIER